MIDLISDPKILAIILTSFGTAIGWLLKNGLSCRKDKAVLEEKLATMRERIAVTEGTVHTLCALLKRETHLG